MDDYAGPAAEVANRLLKSTTTVGDSAIDFEPALRRVQYDLEDIDSQIKQCVSGNTPQLIETVQGVNKWKSIAQSLDPDVENISSEFGRVAQDFLRPYQRLQSAYQAAQRLHQTSELVRGCNWYLQLARELEELLETQNVYAAAGVVGKLQQLLDSDMHIQSLEVVRKHAETLGQVRTRLVASSLDTIKQYDGGRAAVRNAVLGLHMLEKDKLLVAVETWLKAQTSATTLGITRAVATPAAFDSAWQQATSRSESVEYMSQVLGECFMLTRAENKVGGPLVGSFWRLAATNIGQKLHTMSVANPTQVRAMKAQKEHILGKVEQTEAVKKVFSKYLS